MGKVRRKWTRSDKLDELLAYEKIDVGVIQKKFNKL